MVGQVWTGEWTAEAVKAGLVEAFRRTPGAAIMCAQRADLIDALGLDHVPHWDLLAATYWCLGQDATDRDRERRLMLLTWARVTARASVGARESSMREIARELGWDWKRFQRSHKAASVRMAHAMDMASKVVRCVMKHSA